MQLEVLSEPRDSLYDTVSADACCEQMPCSAAAIRNTVQTLRVGVELDNVTALMKDVSYIVLADVASLGAAVLLICRLCAIHRRFRLSS